MDDPSLPLDAWSWVGSPTARPAESGLINQSWWVEVAGRPRGILQRLNSTIFVPEVHEDIEAITSHLAARGLQTPRLVVTREGALWHTDPDGGVWRVLTLVGRDTVHKLHSHARARSAGRLVARFHAAVRDLEWQFRSLRPGAHDTARHMERLQEALAAHRDHRLYDPVAALAERIASGWERWAGSLDLPVRIIHGDLKISNVRFDGDEAMALIDLDTLQHGTLSEELGDALRSWCNPASEDAAIARFDLGIFAAAVEGYAEGAGPDGLTEAEWAAIVPGVERICLELSARFARDALEESYFAFHGKYGTRGDHNLLRAGGQLSLAETVRAAGPHAERKVTLARQRLASTWSISRTTA